MGMDPYVEQRLPGELHLCCQEQPAVRHPPRSTRQKSRASPTRRSVRDVDAPGAIPHPPIQPSIAPRNCHRRSPKYHPSVAADPFATAAQTSSGAALIPHAVSTFQDRSARVLGIAAIGPLRRDQATGIGPAGIAHLPGSDAVNGHPNRHPGSCRASGE